MVAEMARPMVAPNILIMLRVAVTTPISLLGTEACAAIIEVCKLILGCYPTPEVNTMKPRNGSLFFDGRQQTQPNRKDSETAGDEGAIRKTSGQERTTGQNDGRD